VPRWLEELKGGDGTYDYLKGAAERTPEQLNMISYDNLKAAGACISGSPDEVVEQVRRYNSTGADLLLCLVNPYRIPHDKVMQTIELFGRYVIPEFSSR
jgi:alkanesulfonate monooxygenase SsuD/methylene tetrahydromethanopterin reductase-like flavin-dependent oxidoreductase (luciferase family)